MISLSAAPPVRAAVSAAFRTYSKRRVDHLARINPIASQERCLRTLVRRARGTRFGRDHRFGTIGTVSEFQNAVPLRSYEDLWKLYLKGEYPIFDNLTWPGRIPYLALTSGTTQGATKYIPISPEMIRSNLKASRSMVAYHIAARPDSRLFHGKLFFLGGSTALEQPAPGVQQGDLSGIASKEISSWLRPYTFPPLELALEPNWDIKLTRLAEHSLRERITMVGGVPSWLLALFQRLLALSGKKTIAAVWPALEVVVHGGVKFDPYRAAFHEILGLEPTGDSQHNAPGRNHVSLAAIRLQDAYACSEGYVAFGDPATGHLRLMFDHGVFYEFVPLDELDSPRATRHWLGTVQTGINYAIVVSTCAGMWAHIIGDTVRFESLSPPLLTFTGRTKYTLSAFGEHLINEELEGAIAAASAETGAAVRDWHVGPVFQGALGYHIYLVEFLKPPSDLKRFRGVLDADLCRRNADYQAHRAEGVGLPLPALVCVQPGGFEAWMRSRGKLGGQHKVPRMDNGGVMTKEIVGLLEAEKLVAERIKEGTGE
jgi:hypothetical protein